MRFQFLLIELLARAAAPSQGGGGGGGGGCCVHLESIDLSEAWVPWLSVRCNRVDIQYCAL